MGRPRIYDDPAQKYRVYRQRRNEKLDQLRRSQRPPRHQRHEGDVYETPPAFVRAGLDLVENEPKVILDPSAGDGRWGAECRRRWPHAVIVGVELRPLPKPSGFDAWFAPADFLRIAGQLPHFDLIAGNPPYRDGESFVRTALGLLRPGGELVYLLRSAFREGRARNAGLFREYPLRVVAQSDRRPKFYDGRTGLTSFSFFLWREGWHGETRLTTAFIPEEA